MVNVGWWAQDTPLYLGQGKRFRSRKTQSIFVPTHHRTRSILGIGGSGTGKSCSALNLIRQDIYANRGFTAIDAHDLQREVLALIAEHAFGPGMPTREQIANLGDNVVIIDPCDLRYGAYGLNPLKARPGQLPFEVVDSIVAALREIFADGFGDRMADINRNGLTLLQEFDLTVIEMVPLLSDTTFRDALVERSRNEEVKLFFREHLGGLRASDLKMWFEAARNKWSAFASSKYVKLMLAQTSSAADFRTMMDDGKMIIVNLSRDKLKESRRLLGALIITAIHNAAISREAIPKSERIFHTLYVDEFQEYLCPSILHLLEGSRKLALGSALFHQSTNQPPLDTSAAIFDTIIQNTATVCAFAVARKDAARLAGEIFFPSGTETKYQDSFLGIPTERPVSWGLGDEREQYAQELMRQRQAQMYVRLKGLHDEPFSVEVPRMPDVAIHREKIDLLRQHVAKKYYRPVADVEREIRERWARIRAVPADDGRRDFTQ